MRAFVRRLLRRLLGPSAAASFVRDAILRARYGVDVSAQDSGMGAAGSAGEHDDKALLRARLRCRDRAANRPNTSQGAFAAAVSTSAGHSELDALVDACANVGSKPTRGAPLYKRTWSDIVQAEAVEREADVVAGRGFGVTLAGLRGCHQGGCCDVDAGVGEIVLADLLEDVVAKTLGAEHMCAFFQQCFA